MTPSAYTTTYPAESTVLIPKILDVFPIDSVGPKCINNPDAIGRDDHARIANVRRNRRPAIPPKTRLVVPSLCGQLPRSMKSAQAIANSAARYSNDAGIQITCDLCCYTVPLSKFRACGLTTEAENVSGTNANRVRSARSGRDIRPTKPDLSIRRTVWIGRASRYVKRCPRARTNLLPNLEWFGNVPVGPQYPHMIESRLRRTVTSDPPRKPVPLKLQRQHCGLPDGLDGEPYRDH